MAYFHYVKLHHARHNFLTAVRSAGYSMLDLGLAREQLLTPASVLSDLLRVLALYSS